MLATWSVGLGSKTMTSSRYAATRSKPLVTSLMILTNQSGEALLPCGITSHSKSRSGVQNAVNGMVSLSMAILVERGDQVEEGENAPFSQCIKDLVAAGDGKLSEGADGVQLLVVDGDADTAVLLRDGDHGAGIR